MWRIMVWLSVGFQYVEDNLGVMSVGFQYVEDNLGVLSVGFQYVEDNLGVMSVGFLLSSPDDAVIWRGPKKNGTFKILC